MDDLLGDFFLDQEDSSRSSCTDSSKKFPQYRWCNIIRQISWYHRLRMIVTIRCLISLQDIRMDDIERWCILHSKFWILNSLYHLLVHLDHRQCRSQTDNFLRQCTFTRTDLDQWGSSCLLDDWLDRLSDTRHDTTIGEEILTKIWTHTHKQKLKLNFQITKTPKYQIPKHLASTRAIHYI